MTKQAKIQHVEKAVISRTLSLANASAATCGPEPATFSRTTVVMVKSKRRKQKFPHLMGSKWTAIKPVMGWRHFQVEGRQERSGVVFAHLQSVCDDSVSLWLNAKVLKNRRLWTAGWQTLEEMFPERYEDEE